MCMHMFLEAPCGQNRQHTRTSSGHMVPELVDEMHIDATVCFVSTSRPIEH